MWRGPTQGPRQHPAAQASTAVHIPLTLPPAPCPRGAEFVIAALSSAAQGTHMGLISDFQLPGGDFGAVPVRRGRKDPSSR